MKTSYVSLLGFAEGARRIHVHLTTLDTRGGGEGYRHSHKSEEAMYFIEGEAEYGIREETVKVGPGDLLFFPSNEVHGPVRFLSDRMKYLVIRSVEADDEPCCCGKDRPPLGEHKHP
jgi:quercetin dioxygenase-like cupin family protein